MATIGIDLGTSNTCVAVVRNGQVEVLQNDRGAMITPSCVAFTDKEILVGDAAKNLLMQERDNSNKVFSIKRIIGRDFDEEFLEKQSWPFNVAKDIDGKYNIQVKCLREDTHFRPEEISALVLRKIKMIAEIRLDPEKVKDAVITVPSQFTALQRIETKAAATIAGLNVIGMINEPTAAALAYGLTQDHNTNSSRRRYVLVYDLGGGTFDVAVLKIKDARYKIKGQSGDLNLGGDDFTNNIAEYVAQRVTGIRQTQARQGEDWMKLFEKAEKAKVELSFRSSAYVTERDMSVEIDQEKLNLLNMELYSRTMAHVHNALSQARIDQHQIQDVLLCGGSTRIPYVQEMIKNHFPRSKIHYELNPDETVAKGAAILAAQLSKTAPKDMSKLEYVETVSKSLGTDVMGDKTSFIITQNSKLPASGVRTYTNANDNQTAIQICVCQGEYNTFSWNELIDIFTLPIRPADAGTVNVEVKFSLDKNGYLSVTAREKKAPRRRRAKKIKFQINMNGAFRDQRIAEQELKLNTLRQKEYHLQHQAVNSSREVLQTAI